MKKILCFMTIVFLLVPLTARVGTAAEQSGGEGCSCGSGDSFRNDALKRYDRFFDRLVSEGIISADQKNILKSSIEAAVREAHQNGSRRIDMSTILAQLVKDGALTAKQKAAIEDAIRSERLDALQGRVKTALDELVKAGKLTESQEKAILSAIGDASYSAGGRPDLEALLLSLTKYGVISDEQRTAIDKALKPAHGKWHMKIKEDKRTVKGLSIDCAS
jgi:polyhydroxyalkanoate synthesis regulator phasin